MEQTHCQVGKIRVNNVYKYPNNLPRFCGYHKNCRILASTKTKLKTKVNVVKRHQLNPRQLIKLSGVNGFSYVRIFEKNILFLGEKHEVTQCFPQENAFEVHDWLKPIIKMSHHGIDLFVEDPYWIKTKPHRPVGKKSLKSYQITYACHTGQVY
jgi:hypothetical protein